MRSDRFVLDTNIWISYFIANNHQRLVDIAYAHQIDIFSCQELFDELKHVLQYEKLQKYQVNVRRALRLVKEITTEIELAYPIKNYIPEDKDDNYIIALALQTNSGFVTSGDDHILKRKKILETKFGRLKIIEKHEFESMFP
jgi:uncharacterized protein